MREKPIRAFEDFRAKRVGGRSIRKRLARSSSIESAGIIASITAAEAAINSGEQQTLSRFQRDPDGKQDKRPIIIKTAANRRGVVSRGKFFIGILQHGLIRTILCALANDTVRVKAFDIDPSDITAKENGRDTAN